MHGVVRTRVGYAGGTTPDPTYRSIGDHTECVQVDYDPRLVSYDDLLAVFWTAHRPLMPAYSRQYASVILAPDEERLETASHSKQALESARGPLYTDIVRLDRFYVAEDYHQKYRLRGTPQLMREFQAMCPDETAFRESTAAARVNGYLDGWGGVHDLEAEIGSFGLSARGQEILRAAVGGRGRAGVRG